MQLKAPKSYYNYLFEHFSLLRTEHDWLYSECCPVVWCPGRVRAHVRTHTMTALLAGSQASSSGD